MKLRYGVIGAGVVAPLHLEAIAALDDVELLGISALDHEAALLWRSRPAVRRSATIATCSRSSRTSSSSARRIRLIPALAIAALEAGAHVLVEKPLAVEVRDADAMIDAADRAGRLLGVCFQQRFRPVVAGARELIETVGWRARARLDRRPALPPVELLRDCGLARDVGGRGRRRADEPGAAHARPALPPRRPAVDGVGRDAAAVAADGGRGYGDGAARVRATAPSGRWRSRRRSRECSASSSSATAAESRSSARRSRSSTSSPRCQNTSRRATEMFGQPTLVTRERRASGRPGRSPRRAPGLRGGDPNGRRAACAGARRALVARGRERDRALDPRRARRAVAGRPRRLRRAARRPACRRLSRPVTRSSGMRFRRAASSSIASSDGRDSYRLAASSTFGSSVRSPAVFRKTPGRPSTQCTARSMSA